MLHQALFILVAAMPAADPGVDDIVQREFRDVSFTAKIVKANQAELRKISKTFGDSYRFTSASGFLKEPLKMRMESKIDDTQVIYIVNGFQRLVRIPRANYTTREDLKDAPGKVQTPFDIGILTPAVLQELFDAKFVRVERATGDYVFDFTYKHPRFEDTGRMRAWFHPAKRYTTKREKYNRKGQLEATFIYDEPETFGAVTLPTRVTVKNADNKVAGVTDYINLKVNSGLSDSLFAIK